MRWVRGGGWLFLACVLVFSIGAQWLAPQGMETQNREEILAAPSAHHFLGTDDLGRDVFSRMLYGSRISLFVAPASALIATIMALLIGSAAGLLGGPCEMLIHRVIDLFLSVPWIFLLLIVRAMLPLNLSPYTSVFTTILVLGAFGWAASARVVSESVAAISASDYFRQSVAQGVNARRRLTRQIIPNLRPILLAQFWIGIPVFIVGEANLGFLGLGVGEPVPSWGNLLRQLENFDRIQTHPWLLFPLLLVVLVLASFQLTLSSRQSHR